MVGGPAPFIYCSKAKPGQNGIPKNIPWENPDPSEAKDCGIFDFGCMAGQAITGWFGNLVKEAADSTLKLLGRTVLTTPDIDSPNMARARELWEVSQVIANTCFVLLVTLAGILIMVGTSLPREFSPREVIPRVVLAFLAANLSLYAIGYAITLANGLADAFLTRGSSHITPGGAAMALLALVTTAIQTNQVFSIVLALAVVVLATCVAFVYIIRITITVLLIAAAPLALMFHAFSFTEGLARLWWRGLAGMLAIQVCQTLVFVTALQIVFTDNPANNTTSAQAIPTNGPDTMDLLTIICLMWVLLRIPSWVARTIWQQARPRLIPQLIKTFLVYRTVGTVLSKATTALKNTRTTRTRANRPGPGGPNGGRRRRGGGPNGGPGPRGNGPRTGPGPRSTKNQSPTPTPRTSAASTTNPRRPSGAHAGTTSSAHSPHSRTPSRVPKGQAPHPRPSRTDPGEILHLKIGTPPRRFSPPRAPRRPDPKGEYGVISLRIDSPPRRRAAKPTQPKKGT